MKNIFPLIACLFTTMLFAQEKVGINTETPTRTLDVNGNMRVEKQKNENNPNFNDVLIADGDGNVDMRTKQSLMIGENQQVETIRNIYYSESGSNIEKSVKCARFEVTLSNEDIAMIRLRYPVRENTEISYGLRRLERRDKLTGGTEGTGTGEYIDTTFKREFTPQNWNVYQRVLTLQDNSEPKMVNNDSYRLHVVDSETGDFYKIDFTRIISKDADWKAPNTKNDKKSGTRAIICERYFNVNN